MSEKKRLRKYAVDQHSLICDELEVSPSPDDEGDTAFEAVMRLKIRNEELEKALESTLAGFGPMIDLFDHLRSLTSKKGVV